MAHELAPHLFQEEVDPVKFLRTCDFDPWATAERIARYWKHRKLAFGDRWLLPLAQSAYGALLPMDLELMRSGYGIVFEEYIILDHSRLTTFAGTTKYTDEELEASRVRVMFYVMTVTSSENAQRYGKKVLVAVEGTTMNHLWKVQKIWPSRVHSFYFVQHKHRFVDSFTEYWLQFFLDIVKRHYAYTPVPKLVFTSSTSEMLHQLLEAGFPLELIPQKFGGSWSYTRQMDEWMSWLSKRDDERNGRVLMSATPSTSSNTTTTTMTTTTT